MKQQYHRNKVLIFTWPSPDFHLSIGLYLDKSLYSYRPYKLLMLNKALIATNRYAQTHK